MNDDRTSPAETASPPPSPSQAPCPAERSSPAAASSATEGRALPTLLAETAAMVRFYSRLPVPRLSSADDPAAAPPFGRAIRMLPWAALVIALPSAVVVAALAPTDLPGLAVAALAVAVMAAVTGAFHEDGFADVADGFGGGATIERRLEIMKDSRIGAFGGVALAGQFVLRTSLLAEAIDRLDGPAAGAVILAVAALARVAPLMLMSALPPARPDGLGRSAGRPEPTALMLAGLGAGAIAVLVLTPIVGAASLAAALATTVAAALGLGLWARAKIGGFTGDVIGAGTIVAEIAALVGLMA